LGDKTTAAGETDNKQQTSEDSKKQIGTNKVTAAPVGSSNKQQQQKIE